MLLWGLCLVSQCAVLCSKAEKEDFPAKNVMPGGKNPFRHDFFVKTVKKSFCGVFSSFPFFSSVSGGKSYMAGNLASACNIMLFECTNSIYCFEI